MTAARVGAVEKFLNRQIDGGPARLLCPVGARPLITAYRGGYRYRIKKSGESEDSPGEEHPQPHRRRRPVRLPARRRRAGRIAGQRRQQARPVQKVNALGWT